MGRQTTRLAGPWACRASSIARRTPAPIAGASAGMTRGSPIAMVELQLTRASGDRTRFDLGSVGRLRLEGWGSRRATASAGSESWELVRRGLLRTVVEATDAAGEVAGSFRAKALGRGGALWWAGRELSLRSASFWRERYVLLDGDRELAQFEGRNRGKRPVTVTVEDTGSIDPGLLLFATFVVRALARESSSGAAAGGVIAAGG